MYSRIYMFTYIYIYRFVYTYIYIYPPAPLGPPGCEEHWSFLFLLSWLEGFLVLVVLDVLYPDVHGILDILISCYQVVCYLLVGPQDRPVTFKYPYSLSPGIPARPARCCIYRRYAMCGPCAARYEPRAAKCEPCAAKGKPCAAKCEPCAAKYVSCATKDEDS